MGNAQIYKSALESMLYVWGEPLSIKAAADVLGIEYEQVKELLNELKDEYENDGRGIRIRQINRSFQMVTAAENAIFIKRLCTPVKSSKLSQAALEVLAIIAYKQPVTKAEIEAIRGVRADRVVEGLMKRNLVAEKGRSEGIGRPIIYGTTDVFLKQFGFASISELPPFQDLEGVLSDEEIDNSSSTQQLKLKI
ncbi:MAG: SMC-Scp complex subunit ScpB [Clostridiales bacterium]|nr:SMC-Scp complex subunit ScpB [Clostridiales bacterium]MDY6116450.1 SMC-Scp complex subunit ScpB [Anaerovoracaceae bacterium]